LQLDPYDYEMIDVVLKVLEQANEKITSVNINQVWKDVKG
jgi:kinetochore-associated protein 1